MAAAAVAAAWILVPAHSQGASPPAELMSVSGGQPTPLDTYEPTISGDGQVVAFSPGFYRDRNVADQAALSATVGFPVSAAVSRGGCRIAYATAVIAIAKAGAPNSNGGLYVFDRCTATMVGGWSVASSRPFVDVAISDGGRYVAATGRDSAGAPFVVRLDTANGATVQVNGAWQPSIGDENLTQQIAVSFSLNQGPVALWDPGSGTVTPVSLPDGVTDPAAAQWAMQPSMTPDGRYVAFVSDAANLTAQGSAGGEIFVRDVAQNRTALVSKTSAGNPAKGNSAMPSISADGTQIAFGTEAQDVLAPPLPGRYLPPRAETVQLLVARTASGWFDTVAFDRVSVLPSGQPIPTGDMTRTVTQPVISSSGRWVAFVADRYDLLVGQDPREVPSDDTWVIGRPPTVTVSPLDFGQITVGASATLSATVTNTGISSVYPAAITTSAGFAVVGGTCPVNAWLSPGASCTVEVSFTAGQAGSRSGNLTIAENGFAAYSVSGSLQGFGVAPATTATSPVTTTTTPATTTTASTTTSTSTTSTTSTSVAPVVSLRVDPNPADLGSVGVGAAGTPVSLTVTNTGNAAATMSAASIGGANPSEFVITADGCTGSTIAPGGTCPITITLRPTAPGPRAGELSVAAGSVGATATLTGQGLAIPTVRLLPNVFGRGEVSVAVGVGFEPGQAVELHWDGDGRVFAGTADPSGAIAVQIPVGENRPLGPCRLLVADVPGRYSGVFADGLVVEASVRPPSGNNPGTPLYQALIIRG